MKLFLVLLLCFISVAVSRSPCCEKCNNFVSILDLDTDTENIFQEIDCHLEEICQKRCTNHGCNKSVYFLLPKGNALFQHFYERICIMKVGYNNLSKKKIQVDDALWKIIVGAIRTKYPIQFRKEFRNVKNLHFFDVQNYSRRERVKDVNFLKLLITTTKLMRSLGRLCYKKPHLREEVINSVTKLFEKPKVQNNIKRIKIVTDDDKYKFLVKNKNLLLEYNIESRINRVKSEFHTYMGRLKGEYVDIFQDIKKDIIKTFIEDLSIKRQQYCQCEDLEGFVNHMKVEYQKRRKPLVREYISRTISNRIPPQYDGSEFEKEAIEILKTQFKEIQEMIENAKTLATTKCQKNCKLKK